MKKLWIGISIVAVIALAFLLVVSRVKEEPGEIKIGAILPLTGDAAQWGAEAKNAIDLAVKEVNEKGGIKGKKVRVIYEDSQLLPRIGTQAIYKLIITDRVKAIIGAISSSVTLAIAPIAESHKVVLISPASTSHQITRAGDYIFRTITSDVYEGSTMAEFAYNKLGYRKIGAIAVDAAGTKSMADAFIDRFRSLGGEIPIYEMIPQGGSDFRTQLTKLKEHTEIEAIYSVGFPLETGYVLKQARELGIVIPFLSAQPAEDPQVRNIAGNATEGLIFTTTTIDPQTASDATKEFIQKFKKQYDREPGVFSFESYDAINLLIAAISDSGYDGEAIKSYLYTVKDYEGVSGKMSFDKNGDVAKLIRVVKIQNGDIRSLSE